DAPLPEHGGARPERHAVRAAPRGLARVRGDLRLELGGVDLDVSHGPRVAPGYPPVEEPMESRLEPRPDRFPGSVLRGSKLSRKTGPPATATPRVGGGFLYFWSYTGSL